MNLNPNPPSPEDQTSEQSSQERKFGYPWTNETEGQDPNDSYNGRCIE